MVRITISQAAFDAIRRGSDHSRDDARRHHQAGQHDGDQEPVDDRLAEPHADVEGEGDARDGGGEMFRGLRWSDVFSLHPLGFPPQQFGEPHLGRTYDLLIQRLNERIE
jgi:hypothetical protein